MKNYDAQIRLENIDTLQIRLTQNLCIKIGYNRIQYNMGIGS